jgi:hypothetical protein
MCPPRGRDDIFGRSSYEDLTIQELNKINGRNTRSER